VAEKRVTAFGAVSAGISRQQASGISALGRGFAYAAGQSGILTSEMSILTTASQTVGLAAAAAAVGFGAIAGGIGASIKTAIDFESSFAGIRKTVDGTEADFKTLEAANRSMAKSLPISVNEINRIGEAAGQLGISGIDNITKFERTIADIANTTNLTADEAATAFAQIANVMQLPISQIDRLGAAVVDLGNKGASTEKGIIDFSQRIAGAGKIAGLTVAQIAGISSAFASVGIEAEAGGTAIQKVLIELTKSVAEGGDKLAIFAKTAGLTIAQFCDLAKSNPAEAFTRFVEGLGKAGDQAFKILEGLGLEDQRLIRSFLATAQAGDLLRRSIETGTTAFAQNTALATEAEKRYATVGSRLTIMKNNFIDLGISIGDTFLPPLAKSSSALVAFTEATRPMAPALKLAAEAAVLFGLGIAAIKLTGFINNLTLARAATLGLSGTLHSTAVGVGLLAVGFVALDLAAQKFRGQSLIELFTTTDEKARGAAKAVKEFAAAQEIVAKSNVAGSAAFQTSSVSAFVVELTHANEQLDKFNFRLKHPPSFGGLDTAKDVLSGSTFGLFAGPTIKAREAAAQFRGEIDALIKQLPVFAAAQKDPIAALEELRQSLAKQPDVLARIEPALQKLVNQYSDAALAAEDAGTKSFRAAMQAGSGEIGWRLLASGADAATTAQSQAAESADASRKAIADFGKELNQTASLSSRLNPLTEALKAQVLILEQQRRGMEASGQSTAGLDAQIASLRNQLDQSNSSAEIADAKIRAFGAAAFDAMSQTAGGADRAKEGIAALGNSLQGLPREQQIEIITKLPLNDLNRMLVILRLLAQGVTIPIAVAIEGRANELLKDKPSFLRIRQLESLSEKSGFDLNAPPVEDAAGKRFREEIDAINASLTAGADTADNFAKSTGGASKAEQESEAGLIGLSAAFGEFQRATGGTEAQFAALIAQSEEEASLQKQITDATFAHNVELAKAANSTENNRLALLKLGLEMVKAGGSYSDLMRVIREKTIEGLRGAVDALRSAFGGLFGRPTKEQADLNARIAELEFERAKRRAAGADDEELKALDDHIDALRRQRDVLDKHADLLKAQNDQADQTLLTENQRDFAAKLYTIALGDQTGALKSLTDQAGLEALARQHLIDSMLSAADANNAQAGISPQQSNLDFFNSLPDADRLALAKLLEALANQGKLAGGTDYWRGGPALVGEKGPELLNLPRGSRVTPLGESGIDAYMPRNTKIMSAASGAPTVTEIHHRTVNNYIDKMILEGDAAAGLAALGVSI